MRAFFLGNGYLLIDGRITADETENVTRRRDWAEQFQSSLKQKEGYGPDLIICFILYKNQGERIMSGKEGSALFMLFIIWPILTFVIWVILQNLWLKFTDPDYDGSDDRKPNQIILFISLIIAFFVVRMLL